MLIISNVAIHAPPFSQSTIEINLEAFSNLKHRSILVNVPAKGTQRVARLLQSRDKFTTRGYTLHHDTIQFLIQDIMHHLLSLKIISSIFQDFRGMASCTIFSNRHKSCRRIAWAAMEHALTPFQVMHSNILQDFYAPSQFIR